MAGTVHALNNQAQLQIFVLKWVLLYSEARLSFCVLQTTKFVCAWRFLRILCIGITYNRDKNNKIISIAKYIAAYGETNFQTPITQFKKGTIFIIVYQPLTQKQDFLQKKIIRNFET